MRKNHEHAIFTTAEAILADAEAVGQALQAWTEQQQEGVAAARRQEELALRLEDEALHGTQTAFEYARSGCSWPSCLQRQSHSRVIADQLTIVHCILSSAQVLSSAEKKHFAQCSRACISWMALEEGMDVILTNRALAKSKVEK